MIRAGCTLFILALALPGMAAAGEFSTVINGKSYHLGASQDWNEDNLGVGLEYQFDSTSRWKYRLMANGFNDSNDEMSYMAGGGIHYNLLQSNRLGGFYVDAGLNAFVMTRQDVNDNQPFPGVLPSITFGNRYAGFNLTYLPRQAVEKMLSATMADDSIDGIVFLQFKFSMNRRNAD